MNILENLFGKLNKKKINYCVLRKYENLPKKPNGDIDLAIDRKYIKETLKIVNESGFVFYPYTEPHYFFFLYDEKIGLIKLDLIFPLKLPDLKKLNCFYVPKNGEDIRLRKTTLMKIKTNLQRRGHYLFRGKLICFIGPDGSGKSTLLNKTFEEFKEFPLKKRKVYFGSKKNGKLYRMIDLNLKLLLVYLEIFLGRIVFTDRYIYLTFRKNKFLMNLVRFLSPKPHIIFIMKTDPKTVYKRKKEISIEEIEEQYTIFNKLKNTIEIDSSSKIRNCSRIILNKILSLYKNE